MLELQTVVDSLIGLLLTGGSEAAIELSKNTVLEGKEKLSKLWRDIFTEQPESYPLANQVAKKPQDQALQQQLRDMLKQTLSQHPALLENIDQLNIKVGDVSADHGSIAVGVNIGGKVGK